MNRVSWNRCTPTRRTSDFCLQMRCQDNQMQYNYCANVLQVNDDEQLIITYWQLGQGLINIILWLLSISLLKLNVFLHRISCFVECLVINLCMLRGTATNFKTLNQVRGVSLLRVSEQNEGNIWRRGPCLYTVRDEWLRCYFGLISL